jgi:Tol biopolymer transport system component
LVFNLTDEDKVFIHGRDSDERWRDIYSVDLTTGSIENLTGDLTTLDNKYPEIGKPAVSPSGSFIAFTATLDYDTSNWLTNGGNISQNTKKQKTDIYMIDVQSKEVTKLTNGVDGWEGSLKWIE